MGFLHTKNRNQLKVIKNFKFKFYYNSIKLNILIILFIQFSRVLDIVKLQTNITYKKRKQESSSTIAYIDIESEEQESSNINLNK